MSAFRSSPGGTDAAGGLTEKATASHRVWRLAVPEVSNINRGPGNATWRKLAG